VNEKTTEFWKTKLQEAEKKLILEQDKNAALFKKIKEFERKTKEFDLS